MAELLYQGHDSYRITAQNGMVIYIDPFEGKGYDQPADLILVTHEHTDHNKVSLVPQKQGCTTIRSSDALKSGEYRSFIIGGVKIEAVEAYNRNHKKEECVGYILTIDQVSVYAAGDTSKTEQMKKLGSRKLSWALLPIDGVYNMGPEEASECAALIGAAHNIPVHMKPGKLFDRGMAESFHAPGRVILAPGESVELKK
ncbi:MAG TPA: MBL fold metallo-hydrolase [Clostridia bacterium]|nr:MBL fold metallo-hydrolase [Clostridia bacterium]